MDPGGLKYTGTHEWIRREEGSATAEIGITAHAVEQLKDVVYLELPKPGAQVKKDSSFGVIESVKAVFELNSPVSGEVVEANQPLTAKVELLKEDVYGAGWMIRVKLADENELEGLMDAVAYEQYLKVQESEN